jgi:formamidopyrimidine-DNA glycosylase
MGRRLTGSLIERIDRIGKRVVLWTNRRDALVLEPRMTGLVLVAVPPDSGHVRLRIKLSGGPAGELLFWDRRGLARVCLVHEAEFSARYGPHRLGPDALTITTRQLAARFSSRRRAIKVAMLDQKLLAGIGNLYASEILHRAGIHPQTECHQFSDRAWRRLHWAMRTVLREAIYHEGSTLADGTYRNALNGEGRFQRRHRVYARDGSDCRTCGQDAVRRIVQAQRSTFFCPSCQKLAGPTSRDE